MTSTLFFIIGLLFIGLLLYYNFIMMKQNEMKQNGMKQSEGFDNYTLEETENNVASSLTLPLINSFPLDENDPLVEGEFPVTGRKGISNLGADKIWWHYPIFELGSYEQITNNIRYSNNPDEGTCMPASMCGALYKEKHNLSNVVVPLPPVNPDCGTRVGYFTTDVNLLPFRTDVTNVLY